MRESELNTTASSAQTDPSASNLAAATQASPRTPTSSTPGSVPGSGHLRRWAGPECGNRRDNATLKAFYPTTDLVTGPDIIFFWVARMIMAGYEYMGEMPFRNVYFTGIIRDKQGRKMSKSLGNSPDPLDLIDKYGADGLRFGLMRSRADRADVKFDESQIEEGRNFANKLWNACRYRRMQGKGSGFRVQGSGDAGPARSELTIFAIDVLAKLDDLRIALAAAFAEYEFGRATSLLYDFFWGHYCDLYLETIKGDDERGHARNAGHSAAPYADAASAVHAAHHRRVVGDDGLREGWGIPHARPVACRPGARGRLRPSA